MAYSYKDIVITPNKSSSTDDPKIVFSGADSTTNTDITLRTYPTSNGSLSFEGSSGQLFSITNDLTGTIFSVNDISGIPSIEVLDTGTVRIAQYTGNVLIGTATDSNGKVQVNGDVVASGIKTTNYPIIVNDISPQFDGSKNVFDLRTNQDVINNIIDSKDLEVIVNGQRSSPYVDNYTYPWLTPYDSFNGFRVKTVPNSTSVSTLENKLIIYNAPYIGDSSVITVKQISVNRQTKRYPFAATTIALGD